jgi:DNA-binding response OmpR family regulator
LRTRRTSAPFVARVLELHSYQIITAEGGRAALMLIATLDLPIDLLITDITMPDVSGQAVVAELARYGGAPPVLLISGLSEEDVPGLSLPFLRKPFTARELCTRVRQLLGSPPASDREARGTG